MIPRAGLRAAVLAGALAAPAAAPGEEALRVGQIRVRTLDVFSPEEASRGWLYRTADALRVQTRESVIRKFLLFEEGDPFDRSLLEQTERNLRTLPFLKSSSVTASAPHDGVVDVEVVTQDAWTTEPGISFGGKGGATTYGFDLKEKDFLGTGRTVAVSYSKDPDRVSRALEYRDPYLFGPYWIGSFAYLDNSDGGEQRVRVGRPFFSFVDPWATNLFFRKVRQQNRIWQNGRVASLFDQRHRAVDVEYGRAVHASDEGARRVTAGVRLLRDQFGNVPSSPGGPIPEDRDFRYVFVRYEDARNDFVKWNYVNRDVRFEDFDLGRNLLVEAAVSPAAFGAPRTSEFLRVQIRDGATILGRGLVQARLAFQTRLEDGVRNEILSGSLFSAYRFETSFPQTLVFRLQADRGWRLDRDVQFLADGETGLRGYALHAYAGDRRVLFNLEHRVFLGREMLQLVSPGAVVFFDAGAAPAAGQPLTFSTFRSDVGVGLRFSISRAASNSVLRIDAAYALNPDPFGRRRLLVSFSSGQVF